MRWRIQKRFPGLGITVKEQRFNGGVYWETIHHPLANTETIEDLRTYNWPDPDWYDYDYVREQAERYPDRAIMCGYYAMFYYHNQLRGLETSFMDPIIRPRFTRYLLDRLSEFFDEYHRRVFEAAGDVIDISQVTDDYGSQSGLLISPQMFDNFYRGYIQKGIDLAQSYGVRVLHHDDGDIRQLLPRFVDMKMDILNPIQWRCGDWDLDWLKDNFGNRLCFHGGIDNQHTLPFGTPEDVAVEVQRIKETLGKDGTGLIIAPCHNIQANTPIENIITLFEAASALS